MINRKCKINNEMIIGQGQPLCIIAGPCVLESLDTSIQTGQVVRDVCKDLGLNYIFKASFDKANRSSIHSPRGPGLESGLKQLHDIRERLKVPVLTDIHEPQQAEAISQVVDIIQIPAFLCRQTDLLVATASTGLPVTVKKGQFLSPAEMLHVVNKLKEAGCENILLTERGTFFGYHRLVNDFIGLGDLMELGQPVCFDVTHSTQLPGATNTSGGRPERAPLLARAAVAAGVDAVFLECHPNPPTALSDGANMLALDKMPDLLKTMSAIRDVITK